MKKELTPLEATILSPYIALKSVFDDVRGNYYKRRCMGYGRLRSAANAAFMTPFSIFGFRETMMALGCGVTAQAFSYDPQISLLCTTVAYMLVRTCVQLGTDRFSSRYMEFYNTKPHLSQTHGEAYTRSGMRLWYYKGKFKEPLSEKYRYSPNY